MSPTHVGRSASRSEDRDLVTGRGTYLDDLPVDALQVAFVRSPHARARIVRVDTSRAQAAPGVAAVVDAAMLGASNGPVPVIWRVDGLRIPRYPALADAEVAYVGQPVVAVVAVDRACAEDAAELVDVDYEELPPVADARQALDPASPLVHQDLGTNLAYQLDIVSADTDEAFAAAAHTVTGTFTVQRQTALPLECRGIMARPEPTDGRLTIWATVQHPHLFRGHLAEILAVPMYDVRVVVPDLGGAFGAYYEVYPEDVVVGWAARHLRRAVKYVEDRQESFLSTVHARQQRHDAALAVGPDGRFLALRDRILTDIGAFVDYSGIGPSYYTATFLTGPYDIRAVDVRLTCAFTNKVRSGSYRGFGQPQATFVLERLVDKTARTLGVDPVELRRRNFVRPEQFPYTLASGVPMDSGNYEEMTARAVARLGSDVGTTPGGEVRRGVGVACYTESTGSSPSAALAARGYQVGGWECVTVRVERDGAVTAVSGASHLGQGIRTALSQVCADELGLDPGDVRVVTGDTDAVRYGNRGSVGSRSAVIAGAAARQAAVDLATRIRTLAAELLEADPADVVLRAGRVCVTGDPSSGVSLGELAEAVYKRHSTAASTDPTLEATSFYDPPATAFGSGVHVAVVDVDTATGGVDIVRYVIVHDCGTVINPMIVEGQVVGGAAQGIGGALLDELVYDGDAQLRTASMMDYLSPTAMEIPAFDLDHVETPAPFHPLGVKGVGEAGIVGPAAALANAVADALDGAPADHLPLRPDVVWELAARMRTEHADAT